MLDYDGLLNTLFMSYEEKEKTKNQFIIDQITKRTKKLAAKKQAIDDLQYEASLITSDIVNCIRNDLSNSSVNVFSGWDGRALWYAWKFYVRPDKKDWNDDKDYEMGKNTFEYITRKIERCFLKDISDYTFKGVIMYNNDEGYDFQYEIKGIEIEIYIPNFSATNAHNYEDMLRGYALRYKSSSCSWDYISGGFEVEKMNQDLIQFLKNRES